MSDDEDNTIRISTDELSVELSGPAARVQQSYMSLRHALLESYETTMNNRAGPADADEHGDTMQMHASDDAPSAAEVSADPENMSAAVRALAPAASEAQPAVLQLVLHRRNYTKVRLLERSELADSILGQALDASAIRRLYATPETAEHLHDSLTTGDTLWRKLTPAGRREVARQSRNDSEETDE